MATTKKVGKIRAAVVRDSGAPVAAPAASSKRTGRETGPAAVPAPVAAPVAAAVAPVPVPAGCPALELSAELWNGLPGGMAWNGESLSSGRWAIRTVALGGADRRKVLSVQDLTRLHNRNLKDFGLVPEDHPVRVGRAGDEITAALDEMLTAAPGTWPARKTDVVLEMPAYAMEAGFPGSFFRVYVSTDPAAPVPVLFPDYYLVNLGDPAELWPAMRANFWTDGQYVATQGTNAAVTEEAAAAVRALVKTIGPG
jgi:hypothetical protein